MMMVVVVLAMVVVTASEDSRQLPRARHMPPTLFLARSLTVARGATGRRRPAVVAEICTTRGPRGNGIERFAGIRS